MYWKYYKRRNQMSFRKWFDIKWSENKGLLTQATAAKLLQLSVARVYRLRKEGKIREYVYRNDKSLYLSKCDVEDLSELYELKRKFNRKKPADNS